MSPSISVIMPVYNAERYVGEAIESILAQTWRDFEFIIVDDGSTDGSSAVLGRYGARDSRIRLRRTANAGVVSARNLGLEMAKGESLAIMDADDRADSKRLEMQRAFLEENANILAVGSNAIMMDEDGEALGQATVPQSHEEIETAHLRGEDSIFNSAVMLRTEAVRRVGGYRLGIMPGEDYDLWLRLGEVGRLANLPEPLLHWRRTVTGLTASHQRNRAAMINRILRDAWQRRGLCGDPPAARVSLQSKGDLYRQWGWTALKNREVRTARKYAARSVRCEPWKAGSWRLAYCALRGR